MPLRVYNSLSRRVEDFEPRDRARTTVYGCGPTVYNHVHIGNWSTFLFYDVFVRWLRASGYGVRYVVNVTDVEDKIIRDSRAAGEDRASFAARWTQVFFDDLDRLGCVRADAYPRATDYVPEMAAMVQTLLDGGHAYLSRDEDGTESVYFRIRSFETYGELANLSRAQVMAGASGRVKADEYEKEEVGDFALWKGWSPSDGDTFWEPELVVDGTRRVLKGRPGWHIECSVMSSALLGPQIDAHLGGEDLRFPHHQNEIAQSEAATGKRPFVRYWMHRRHLTVEGRKMSKSAGSFYTLRDLEERAGPFSARAFRYLVASSHYRTPISFSWEGLDAAGRTLLNLDDAWRRLARHAGDAVPSDFAAGADAAFRRAMDDDLETSAATAAVHSLVGEANRRIEAGSLAPGDAASALALLRLADDVLGLGLARNQALSAEQQTLLGRRETARARRDWAGADRLRAELRALGVIVKDTKEGQEVTLL